MGVREDRLWAEYEAMKKFRSQVVTWETVGNSRPPDVYRLSYKLKSMVGFNTKGVPRFHAGFKVKVRFPSNYPRKAPQVHLISKPWPYHPNVWANDGRFCLEGTQHWIPGIGVPLDAICQMIGEIIAFQEVFLGSPANANPALRAWIEENLRFESIARVTNPIDPSPIRLPDAADTIRWGEEPPKPAAPRIRFG